MMQSILTVFVTLTFLLSCTEESSLNNQSEISTNSISENENYDQSCEWCGANEAPEDLDWSTQIAEDKEPGEPMIISGTVYKKDGKTPAPDVIVYVYHTNAEGKYPKKGNETGNGKRHGYLRAWMKTNKLGQYQFKSIRPAAYKTHGGEPAHIHYVIKPPGKKEYWIEALQFADDPRLNAEQLNNSKTVSGKGTITELIHNENGILIGNRDIILKD